MANWFQDIILNIIQYRRPGILFFLRRASPDNANRPEFSLLRKNLFSFFLEIIFFQSIQFATFCLTAEKRHDRSKQCHCLQLA